MLQPDYMRKTIYTSVILYLFLLVSCHPVFRSVAVEYSNYNVQQKEKYNSLMSALILPYSDSINKSMNDVVGINETLLVKSVKKNTLGFFMTDAYLYMAKQKFNAEIDAAFMNQGGIRLNELAAGKITKGTLFELMPFDNLLLLQKVSGKILKQYIDSNAYSGAVVQSGLTMTVRNRKAENIKVGNRLLDENADYVIANSDYVISSSEALKNIPVQNIGYLQRDAIIEYVLMLTQKGRKIVVENTNRVDYAD